MVEKVITSDRTPQGRNVIDFLAWQQGRRSGAGTAAAICARRCRHCGAALLDGESDDDCSSAGLGAPALRAPPRRFYAE